MALVLDTGVLYAALDRADADHEPCRDLIAGAAESLIVPAPVLVEVDYWVRKFAPPPAWIALAEDVAAGIYSLYPLDSTLLLAAARLQERYADLPLGLVDAAVFATCEALGETKVATLDRRTFSILKKRDGTSLSLVPA